MYVLRCQKYHVSQRSLVRADRADPTATAHSSTVPIVAVTRPGQVNTCADAETGSCPVSRDHASTAKPAWTSTNPTMMRPPEACQRASTSAPMPRSSTGHRDINTSMISTPYPASMPETCATSATGSSGLPVRVMTSSGHTATNTAATPSATSTALAVSPSAEAPVPSGGVVACVVIDPD